jgi:hypothetical protein
MRTARCGKIIRSYMEPGNQAQTIRMIVENQNPLDGFATDINFRRCNNGEDSPSFRDP